VIERVPCLDQRGVDRPPGQRLEGDRANEFQGRAREDDINFGARLCEQPGQPRGLVAGNASRNTEEDAAV
jgi:hypothetical protein